MNTSQQQAPQRPPDRIALRRGFTLVELLLTLAVLVTVAALATVPLTKWLRSAPLNQSVALLQQELSRTRLLAIDNATVFSVTLNAGTATFTRTCPTRHPQHEQTFRLSDGVRFAPTPDSKQPLSLMFQPDGTVSSSVVTLEDAEGIRAALKMDRLTGMVRHAEAPLIEGRDS